MAANYKHLVQETIENEAIFVKATFTRGLKKWIKVIIRPVVIKGRKHLQFSYFDEKKDITKNYFGNEVVKMIRQVLQQQFKTITLQTTEKKIQIEIHHKGKAIVHEHKTQEEPVVDLSHDHQKSFILPADTPVPFLQTVGIQTADGKIKADKQHKFKQINEFLKIISQSITADLQNMTTVRIVDFGCGNGYLTFAVYHYFNEILEKQTYLTGVDVNDAIIKKLSQEVKELQWEDISFQESKISNFRADIPADIAIALHACDTATDDALAQAITMGSKYIFASPCCHHNLQMQLANTQIPSLFQPMFHQTILGERYGDILTDTFRGLILQIMGYKTDIIQFIPAEHTAKNLMIRGVKVKQTHIPRFIHEYKALKKYWKVTPYLEKLLGREFSEMLKQ